MEDIPKEGFIKLTAPDAVVSGSDRAALIRKGNALFNAGNIEQAKKIYVTTRYGDGLSRVGDHYLDNDKPLEALQMYWIAPAPDKVEKLVEKFAHVVQSWIGGEATPKDESG